MTSGTLTRTCTRCGHTARRPVRLTERLRRLTGERESRRCLTAITDGRCACTDRFHDGR